MGMFRKRKPEQQTALDKLLDGYSATRPPSATHSKVETILCWRCRRPNMYDARFTAPKTCAWCRAQI